MSGALEAAILSKLTQDGKAKTPRRKILKLGDSWTCPIGVRTVSGMVIGNGAPGVTSAGGSSGGINFFDNQAVTPGLVYTAAPSALPLTYAWETTNLGQATSYAYKILKTDVPGTLIAFIGNGQVQRSTDYGRTWGPPISTGAISANNIERLGSLYIAWQANGSSYATSADNGLTWTVGVSTSSFTGPQPGASSASNQPTFIATATPGTYAVLPGNTYFMMTKDYGVTWTKVALPLGFNYNNLIYMGGTRWVAPCSTNSNASGDLSYSSDNGATWTSKKLSGATGGQAVAIGRTGSNGELIASTYNGNAWIGLRSTDYGATWTNAPGAIATSLSGNWSTYVFSATRTLLYNANTWWTTADAGASWTQCATSLSNYQWRLFDFGNGRLFAQAGTSSTSTAYYTSDYGATWTASNASVGYTLTVAVLSDNRIVFNNGMTVYTSTNYGATFTSSVASAPTIGTALYDIGAGLYASPINGTSSPNIMLSPMQVSLALDSVTINASPGIPAAGTGTSAYPGMMQGALAGGVLTSGVDRTVANAQVIPGVTSGGNAIGSLPTMIGQGGSGANQGAMGGAVLDWYE